MATARAATLILLACALLGGLARPASPQDGASGSALAAAIDELLGRSAARRTLWGILVRDLDTGGTIYARNRDKLFVPASNAKLFSTALALQRLGPDYVHATTVETDGQVGEDGRLDGDLRLVGGGDPNLSSRVLPFRRKADFAADRLAPMRRLARQVREAGIRSVSGDIVGDSSRYVWQPYTRGWAYADTLKGYGSAASALVFNDNVIDLVIAPGAEGGPARLLPLPALPFYTLANRTLTTPGRHVSRGLEARRGIRSGEVVVSGQIPARSSGRTLQLAALDPARFAALALRRALTDAGVEVEGRARAHHLLPDRLPSLRSRTRRAAPRSGRKVAEIPSRSIAEAIRVVNKESQNLHAEMLMREVALLEARIGSREAAVASMRRFLAEIGIGAGEFVLRDGSGLSRQNLLSPGATVQLLEHMWTSRNRQAYLDSLPVAGQDGTLDWRFRRSAALGRIRAKTGSMSHVLALSGYALTGDGRAYAFSIFANNFGLASSSTRHLVDSIAAAVVNPGPS